MQQRAALVGSLALVCAGCIRTADTACSGHVTLPQARTADFVRTLDRTWGQRWSAGDAAYLNCLYDPTWHYVTAGGVTDKQHDLAASRRAAATRHHPKAWPIDSVVAYLDGDFAAAAGLTHSPDGKRARRWVDYFLWDGTRWHAVFSQATPVR